MDWKKLPSWLKGGLIGGLVGLVLAIIPYYWCDNGKLFAENCGIFWRFNLTNFYFIPLWGFFLGAYIGFRITYKKNRSKNKIS